MENILIEFVNTLDSLLKKLQAEAGQDSSVSRLTINQFHYIEAIYDLGQPTITQIADELHFSKASVTGSVNKLAGLGYLTKTRSIEDRRVFHVSLTAAGERLVQAKYRALHEYGEFIRASLSVEEASQLEAILTKLVQLFQQK